MLKYNILCGRIERNDTRPIIIFDLYTCDTNILFLTIVRYNVHSYATMWELVSIESDIISNI